MTYADGDCITTTAARVGVRTASVSVPLCQSHISMWRVRFNLHQASERILVAVEHDRRRRAAECAGGARVSSSGQAVSDHARVIIHVPSMDSVAEILLVANGIVEAWADGGSQAGGKRNDEKAG